MTTEQCLEIGVGHLIDKDDNKGFCDGQTVTTDTEIITPLLPQLPAHIAHSRGDVGSVTIASASFPAFSRGNISYSSYVIDQQSLLGRCSDCVPESRSADLISI